MLARLAKSEQRADDRGPSHQRTTWWVRDMPNAQVRVRIIPRAKRDDVSDWRGGAVVIRLRAAPVEGAANKALSKFLAKRLGVRASDITIVSGEKSRDKVLRVEGISQEDAERALAPQ